jgi:hypothetical protein
VQTAEVGEVQHQPGSGPIQRRVVFKAAALAEGPNTRFVATTRTERPLVVYARYIDRGEPENWIKELKNALQADRLSDRRFWANAFSLVLHAAAYWLLDTLRPSLRAADTETARLHVVKIGGWVREVADRYCPQLCLHLGSYHPGAGLLAPPRFVSAPLHLDPVNKMG